MIDAFAHFYTSCNPVVRFILDVTIGSALVRAIFEHKLTAWLLRKIAQTALGRIDILGFIMKHVNHWNIVARKVAILQHYRNGHEHEDVVGCSEENCGMFTESPQVNRSSRPSLA